VRASQAVSATATAVQRRLLRGAPGALPIYRDLRCRRRLVRALAGDGRSSVDRGGLGSGGADVPARRVRQGAPCNSAARAPERAHAVGCVRRGRRPAKRLWIGASTAHRSRATASTLRSAPDPFGVPARAGHPRLAGWTMHCVDSRSPGNRGPRHHEQPLPPSAPDALDVTAVMGIVELRTTLAGAPWLGDGSASARTARARHVRRMFFIASHR
jgi:hypothetical protein